MPYIPPEVVAKAKEMDLLTYLQNYEPDELVHFGGNTYCTRTHDSLKISNGKWCWFSRGIGGKTALDYLIKVRDIPFTEAVEMIVGQAASRPPAYAPPLKKNAPKVLLLPPASRSAINAVNYTYAVNNYIVKPLGDMYLSDVTADDIRLALIPVSQMSEGLYNTVNMLIKCIFYAAERNQLLDYNPSAGITAKGGKPTKKKDALTDDQVKVLLDTVRELPPYVFIMIGLYSGLRREEILALQWDSVYLDTPTPYISVQRAWRAYHNEKPEISTVLKTKAAKRDVPIPKCLVDCLREVKETSNSKFVIADSNGEPLTYSRFQRMWKYVTVRTVKPRPCYKYVNGERIKYMVSPELGSHQKNNPKLVYNLDFDVTPHQLRHTYITNLLYAGVDPKTVQYLAGHENSKTTMDIYAKIKYNKPEELIGTVNAAFKQPGTPGLTVNR